MSQSNTTKNANTGSHKAARSRIRKRLGDKLTNQIIGIVISGILIFLLLTVTSCRKACEDFERIDL